MKKFFEKKEVITLFEELYRAHHKLRVYVLDMDEDIVFAVSKLVQMFEKELGWYMDYLRYLRDSRRSEEEPLLITHFSRSVTRRIERYTEIVLDIAAVLEEGVETKGQSLKKFKAKYLNKKRYCSEIIIGILLFLIGFSVFMFGILVACAVLVPVVGQITFGPSVVLTLGGISGGILGIGLIMHGFFGINGIKKKVVRDFVYSIEKKQLNGGIYAFSIEGPRQNL